MRRSLPGNAKPAIYASVTSMPALFKAFISAFGMPWSVMTWCKAEGSTISERLRRPNLLESQVATVRLAISTMTRFTFAS